VRPASGTDGTGAQTSRSRPSLTRPIRPTSPEHPIPSARARVTVESVTDEEAGQSRPPRPSGLQTQYDLMRGASPESEQQDSSLGIPAAQSTAQNVPREETQFHSVLSHPPSENTSRFSRNSLSIERVLCEHTSQAETRAQSAYEQSRAALDLISKSMDNVRGAFTEAKRARDRFHDILSVSSRSRQSVRRHAAATSPSVQRAEREAAGDIRKVAEYQRRVRSQVLDSDERRELQPSPVSSWRLRSGMYPVSLSRIVEGQNDSMDLGTQVSTAKNTPSEASRNMNAHRLGVCEWVANLQVDAPQWPVLGSERRSTRRTVSPVARAEEVLACHNPNPNTPITPTVPRRTTGERVSWLD